MGGPSTRPTDWEGIETATDDQGRPLFTGLYTNRQQPVLFGRPVVLSNKVPAGTAIIGNFTQTIVTVREDIELAWSDGGDLFTTNTARFRAEGRFGFNVLQPSAFTIATLNDPAA